MAGTEIAFKTKRSRVAEAIADDQFGRIRYMVANAFGVPPPSLSSPPSRAAANLARSLAIALSRSILAADLDLIAKYFGCADAEEAACHCNAVAMRAERDARFQITAEFAKAACAKVLGLDCDA